MLTPIPDLNVNPQVALVTQDVTRDTTHDMAPTSAEVVEEMSIIEETSVRNVANDIPTGIVPALSIREIEGRILEMIDNAIRQRTESVANTIMEMLARSK